VLGAREHPRVAVLGAGAVGCFFGGMLARAGMPVTLIGRARHVDAINADGLFFDGLRFQERIRISATTDVSVTRDADIVLFCVKTVDTEEAAKLLPREPLIVSLQNGVDNVARIRAATGIEAIPAVVYVGAAMTAPGRVKHTGRGDLVIGDIWANERLRRSLADIAEMFGEAEVPCRVSENVEGELWTKMIINCAYNAISALGRAKYAMLVRDPLTRDLMRQVTEEAIAVARAGGVRLPDVDLMDTVWKIGEALAGATSSTAQDIARGSRTEIDSLNGYIVRRGAELGIPTPANQTLYALIRLREAISETGSEIPK
jgi:2-dehydropantoate 2-reductase